MEFPAEILKISNDFIPLKISVLLKEKFSHFGVPNLFRPEITSIFFNMALGTVALKNYLDFVCDDFLKPFFSNDRHNFWPIDILLLKTEQPN